MSIATGSRTPRGCVKNWNPWTADELAILREFYPVEFQAVTARLPGRSAQSCRTKASVLGICVERHWTPAEDKTLSNLWGEIPFHMIPHRMGRTEMSIHCRAKKIGLAMHAPDGWESLSGAAKRVGMTLASFRRMLEWAFENGAIEKTRKIGRLAYTARRKGRRYNHRVIEASEVDDAIEAWCKSEEVEVAARSRGVSAPTLRRALRMAGVPRPPLKAHWRLTTEVIDRALAARAAL